jgi:hypothetical protein
VGCRWSGLSVERVVGGAGLPVERVVGGAGLPVERGVGGAGLFEDAGGIPACSRCVERQRHHR